VENLKEILDSLSDVAHSGARMPELDLVKVMGRILDLLQEDAKALGITSGKYVVSRGDPRGLDDKDVLKAIKPHVPKDTYKEIAAASKIGELQDEFGDWYADDSDDELYPVLEPIARRNGLFEDLESASNVVFFLCPSSQGKKAVIAADWTWHDGKFFTPELYKTVKDLEKSLAKIGHTELFDFEYY
jgi:hypothetical protein